MRRPAPRLGWSILLVAAAACGGSESDLTAPAATDGLTAATQSTARVIAVSPSTNPVSFGTVTAPFESATPATQIFTVTNVGTKVTSGLTLSLSGTGAAAYSIKPGDDGCTGRSLGVSGKNKSCTVKLTFAPSAAGSYTGALNIAVAQPKALVSVNLSGTGANATSITIRSAVISGADVSAGFAATGGLLPATFNLINGGSQTFTPAPGVYGVGETAPAGYNLIGISCTNSGSGTSVVPNVPTASVSITIANGGSVACTFSLAAYSPLTVTIDQASYQADPAYSPEAVVFEVVFSNPVTGFDASDVSVSWPGSVTSISPIDQSGMRYQVVVAVSFEGVITATIPADQVTDLAGQLNAASTSTDNSVEVFFGVLVECLPGDNSDPNAPFCSSN